MVNTEVIAEVGVNHDGSVDKALVMIEEAAAAGADAVKFQCFRTNKIVVPNSPKAPYQQLSAPDSKTQNELLKALELPSSVYRTLKAACQTHHVDFLSTPFDLDSLASLLDMGMDRIKISSGDMTFGPLLLKAAQSGKPIILSTGMSDESEIKTALSVLAYGYLNPNRAPKNFNDILAVYPSQEAQSVLEKCVTLLHCTSEYPAPFNELNLKAMQTIQQRFQLKVGFSDHSLGILAPCLAVAMGATVIEKHITLDCHLSGPDHRASLDIAQFTEMVEQIRLTETILGSSIKAPTSAEQQNRDIVRRGLYLKKALTKGSQINAEDILSLRPAAKKTPMHYWDVVGRVASVDYEELEAL